MCLLISTESICHRGPSEYSITEVTLMDPPHNLNVKKIGTSKINVLKIEHFVFIMQ